MYKLEDASCIKDFLISLFPADLRAEREHEACFRFSILFSGFIPGDCTSMCVKCPHVCACVCVCDVSAIRFCATFYSAYYSPSLENFIWNDIKRKMSRGIAPACIKKMKRDVKWKENWDTSKRTKIHLRQIMASGKFVFAARPVSKAIIMHTNYQCR